MARMLTILVAAVMVAGTVAACSSSPTGSFLEQRAAGNIITRTLKTGVQQTKGYYQRQKHDIECPEEMSAMECNAYVAEVVKAKEAHDKREERRRKARQILEQVEE